MKADEILRRLKEIEERISKTTPGPWEYREEKNEQYVQALSVPPGDVHSLIAYEEYIGDPQPDIWEQTKADFTFIAHARSDVPWLCELVQKLLTVAKEREEK